MAPKRKNNSADYDRSKIKVARLKGCKKAFMNMHAVSNSHVFRICKLLLQGVSPTDKCGKNPNINKTPESTLKLVYEHIMSFPLKTTHYSGKEIKYLNSDLTVRIMHDLYNEKHADSTVKYDLYRKYFNENFNYPFGRPQVDVCSKCEELQLKLKSPHLNEKAKLVARAELAVHKRKSSKFYSSLQDAKIKAKSDETIGAVVFDYMQNLPLPHIPIQQMFYLRQIWVYCFSIHDLKTEHSTVYLYQEGLGKKGANEVASFVLDYIKNDLSKTVTKLLLFSDGCVGQNKNHTFIRMCMALVQAGILKEVTHKFPERGHSFLPCDRDFASFKRKIKTRDRIYTPFEYLTLIANSKKNVTVKLINGQEILDFDKWWPKYYKKNAPSLLQAGTKVHDKQKIFFAPTSFKEIRYLDTGEVVGLPFIDGLVQNTFYLRKNHEAVIPGLLDNIPAAYPSNKVPIARKKIDDVKKVKEYVTSEAMSFYEELLSWPVAD